MHCRQLSLQELGIIYSTTFDYLYALADHYAKRGRWPEALNIAERMIAVAPENRIGHDLKMAIEREMVR